jgi:hypothetical protein
VFSNTLNLCSSHIIRDQVSHPYKTTGKLTVFYILIFSFYTTDGKTKSNSEKTYIDFIRIIDEVQGKDYLETVKLNSTLSDWRRHETSWLRCCALYIFSASSASYYFLSLGSNCSSQHPVLKHSLYYSIRVVVNISINPLLGKNSIVKYVGLCVTYRICIYYILQFIQCNRLNSA